MNKGDLILSDDNFEAVPQKEASRVETRRSAWSVGRELTKLKLTAMATVPAVLAFLAAGGAPTFSSLLLLVAGVLVSAGGSAALNQWSERTIDARMERTRKRPIPSGALSARVVLFSGLALLCGGTLVLGVAFNPLAALLAFAAGAVYWLVYTPLKRRTPWCTEVGAVAGAMPVLIGWAAVHNSLAPFAWMLFAILFLWQMPHFHPIAWLYREDYASGGLRMRVLAESSGNQAANCAMIYAIDLLVLPGLLFSRGYAGGAFLLVGTVMGLLFVGATVRFRFAENRDRAARALFRFSLVYLPVVLAVLTAERLLSGFPVITP